MCCGVRLVSHALIETLNIAHIDCDAFYASIEKRDNPSLATKPVIVGGGTRGVVTTCCYIARTYGVRSAMPMFKALKLCPNAEVIKPRMKVYSEVGREIRSRMQDLSPIVQPVSIDEAYIDLTGMEKLHKRPSAIVLMQFQQDIERDLGLTVSVGLSSNRFLAKTASELEKPRGFSILSEEDAPTYFADKSPRAIHGVGPKFAKKLEADGYATIGDLQSANLKQLINAYGQQGLWLHERAFGKDSRKVEIGGERKSISSETTFNHDISDLEQLNDILWRLCERVAESAKNKGVEGRTVSIKLKTNRFTSITRQASAPNHTQLAQTIFRTARELLKKVVNGDQYRLIGVGISDLIDVAPDNRSKDMVDLADPQSAKRAAAERAMDKARAKFGVDSVTTGRGARARKR